MTKDTRYCFMNSLISLNGFPMNDQSLKTVQMFLYRCGSSPPYGGVGVAVTTVGEMAPERIYIFSNGATQIYNPEIDSWTFGASLPTKDLAKFSAAVINDTIYSTGGTIWRYPGLLNDFVEETPSAANTQYMPFGYGAVPPVISAASPPQRRRTMPQAKSLEFHSE